MQIFVDIFILLVQILFLILVLTYLWRFWMAYVNSKFMDSMDFILLEIKIPKEVFKSPESMELIAQSFLQSGGVGTWYDRNWKGNLVTFFSLEIASLEGDVRFYVRCQKKFKSLISNAFYSQYPGIQILEVEDYVTKIFYDHRNKDVSVWGANYKLGAKFKLAKIPGKDNREKVKKDDEGDLDMPADFKMIKTYVDYKQDKDPKEEYEHDPLSQVLEWLGSLGKGEFAYYQIILQDAGKFDGKVFAKTYHNEKLGESFDFKELCKERLEQLRGVTKKKIKVGEVIKDEWGYDQMMRNPKYALIDDPDNPGKKKPNGEPEMIPKTYAESFFTKDELKNGYKLVEEGPKFKDSDLNEENREEVKTINRKLSKPTLRALIRVMTVVSKDVSGGKSAGGHITSMTGILKQFGGGVYNSFAPFGMPIYDYNWQDSFKRRIPWRNEEFFESYIEREVFYPHLKDRSGAESFLGKLILGYGIDWYADVNLFNKSLGFRKKLRMLYEHFFDPFEHPLPEGVFTLNLEELATIWHLPGTTVSTPGIKRIDSTESNIPTNLPK